MKRLVKGVLFAVSLVVTSPFWLCVLLLRFLNPQDKSFASVGQFFSLIPGLAGVYLRRAYYAMTLEECSKDCFVEFGTWFSHRQSRVGSNVYIGSRCSLGMVDIGDNVLIGSNVDILSGKNQHHIDDLSRPIKDQGGSFERIAIGEGCWIGNSSVLMAGVGANSIVGAGSVVVKELPGQSIAVGNPARVVDTRFPENENLDQTADHKTE